MLINGLDAKTTYGVTITDAPGWSDAPPRSTPSAQVLKRGGARVLGDPRDQPRQISLRGWIHGTSTQDARNKADALKLAIKKLTGAKLSFDDYPTRYVIARCDSLRVPALSLSMVTPKLQFEATLTAHDPYSYDNASVGPVALDGTANNHQALGTGPSKPIITLVGAKTNPVLTLWDATGLVQLGQLTFTVVLGGGDTLVIDCDAKTVKLNGVNRVDLLTTGDFFIFEPLVDTAPAIAMTGTGAGTGSFTYRKAWR